MSRLLRKIFLRFCYVFALTITLLLSSCSEDSIFSTSDSDGLHLALQIGASTMMQRAISTSSDDALKEDVLNDLNVWIYDPTNSDALIKHYYLSSNLSNNQTSLLQGGTSWRSGLTTGNTYQVYAVANYGSDLGSLALTDLKTRTISDKNIYIPYNTSSNSSKRFIMDGKKAWTVSDSAQNRIKMTLQRAASKIVVHLNFSSEMQSKLTAVGPVTWRLKNYSSEPTIIAEGSLDDRKVENNPGETTPLSITLADTKNTSTFLTYTYANDSTLWNADPIAHQTLLMLNMPCTYDGKTYAENTYSIPITTSHIDRNYIYELDATIGKLSSNASETEPAYLKYYIEPWITGDVIPINGSNTAGNYLYVTPDTVIMKQTTTDTSIEYISSKDVTISIEKAYYFNSNGIETDLDKTTFNTYNITATPTADSNPRQGKILVTSNTPTNLGPRYIKITVSNPSESKSILVKQYPLEYITSVSGSYSYKDNGSGSQVLNSYDPKAKKYTRGTINKPKDDIFTSKYYNPSNSVIYETGSSSGSVQGAAQTSNPNNQMYVVRITTTSSKYIVDKPLITDGITDGSAANNNVVSPAFMLASQLGTVYPTSWSAASDHCKKYVEISASGKKYDDWRLPTLAELEIISTYQVQSGQNVMTTVLAGDYYWSAYHASSGTWVDDTYQYVGSYSGDYSLCNSDGYYYVGYRNGDYSYGGYWNGYYYNPYYGDYKQGTPGTYYYVGSRNGSYKYVAGYWNYSDNYGYYGTGYGNYTGRQFTSNSNDTHYIRCIRDMSPEELSNDK